MTKRLLYTNYWAEGGTATDPDTDTTHPSYVPNKYSLGWISQKPPEEWQNFLSQITDEKVINMIIEGIPYADASVTYGEGAIFKNAGKIYVMDGGTAKEVMDIDGASYSSLVANLNSTLSAHLAADNPHQDTVNTLVDKTYIKTDVNSFFGSPTDPRTIVFHKLQMGASVHGETPAQLGTLPVAGGTFTGPVVMERDAIVNLSPSKLLHLNGSTALFELASGTVSLGIDGNGNCWLVNTAGSWLLMTESLYNSFQIRWGNRFALPLPYLEMNLQDGLSDGDSVGGWIIQVAATPMFHDKGGVKVDDNVLSFTNFNVPTATTVQVIGRKADGTRTISVLDFSTVSTDSSATLLTAMGMTDTIYIERVVCYPTLTSYQKSMLVN